MNANAVTMAAAHFLKKHQNEKEKHGMILE